MPAHYRYAWQALAAGEDVAGNAPAARAAMREADRWTAMARR